MESAILMPLNPSQSLGADEVLRSLDFVLASPQFRAGPRLAGFLRFVVTTTLAGQGCRLKGYTIAVEALGRPASLDPQLDPIVRVEALRLRRALARYYAGAGAADPVVIDLPLGRYEPTFRRRVPVRRLTGWIRLVGAVLRAMLRAGFAAGRR